MDWILHIGTQKTGSKAIQNFLKDNSELLARQNIIFPSAGRSGAWHDPIYEELAVGKSQQLSLAMQEGIRSKADLGVISCENLYLLNKTQIELISSVLGSSKVILYVRRQDQLANSMLNQLIKAHRINYEYINNFESKLFEYNLDYDHMATIERWNEVFGSDNIKPIIYDKKTNSIETFFTHLGMKDVANFYDSKRTNPNPALNPEALAILKMVKKLNKADEDLPHLVTTAHQVLQNNFVDTYRLGDQYLLSNSQREAIYEKYSRSNSELHAKYFPDREDIFQKPELTESQISSKPVNLDIVYKIYEQAGIPCMIDS